MAEQSRGLRRAGGGAGCPGFGRGRCIGSGQPRQDPSRCRRCRTAHCKTGNSLTARLIDGKAIAAHLRAEVAAKAATSGFTPCLAVVLVGEDPASQVYVRTKDRAAREAGIET